MDKNYWETREQELETIELAFAVMSGKVSNAINRIMTKQLRNAGIDMTPEQWLILTCLWRKVEGENPTQNMIAKATFKDRPSVTRLLRNLERQDLIYRTEKADDKRANYVMLTEKGKKLEAEVNKVTAKALEYIFYDFTEEEIEKSIELLGRVFANLQ